MRKIIKKDNQIIFVDESKNVKINIDDAEVFDIDDLSEKTIKEIRKNPRSVSDKVPDLNKRKIKK